MHGYNLQKVCPDKKLGFFFRVKPKPIFFFFLTIYTTSPYLLNLLGFFNHSMHANAYLEVLNQHPTFYHFLIKIDLGKTWKIFKTLAPRSPKFEAHICTEYKAESVLLHRVVVGDAAAKYVTETARVRKLNHFY